MSSNNKSKSNNNHKVSAAVREQILAELKKPGCLVSTLAKTYNVSTSSIYSWRKEARGTSSAPSLAPAAVPFAPKTDLSDSGMATRTSSQSSAVKSALESDTQSFTAIATSGGSNFVELAISEVEISKTCSEVLSDTPPVTLQKASLVFEQFSLHIDGKLPSKTLVALIQILEEASC